MAIKYYTGVPRSGKTYKAMVLLYYTFVKPRYKTYIKYRDYFLNDNEVVISEKPFFLFKIYKIQTIDFVNAYTNINQFDFTVSPNILQLDFNDLYNKLKILHNLYLLKKPDSELINKAIELNIFRTLFVMDECHNFLRAKEDAVLVWWFTYHAHLHHELILITQDLSLVNTEYKRVAEYFYRAIPSRFRMSKNTFKYIQYSTAGMYEKDKIGVDTVRADKNIFSLYVSGSDSNGKSILHKYLFMALVALIACFVSVYSLMSSIAPVDEEIKDNIVSQNKTQTTQPINNSKNATFSENQTLQTSINSDNQTNTSVSVDPLLQNLKLFKFNCFDTLCYFQFDDKSTFEIPQNILKVYLLDIEDKNKFLELKNNRLAIYVLAPETKFNFIKERGNENEKNKNENPSFIPSISK